MANSNLPGAEKAHKRKSSTTSQFQTTLVPYHRQWAPRQGKEQLQKRSRWRRRWFVACCLITLIVALVASQGNGEVGAWVADSFRATFGPTLTAQVESWYLGISDSAHQLQYQLNGKHVVSPWTVKPTAIPTKPSSRSGSTPTTPAFLPMSLPSIQPMVTPSIAGEGIWAVQNTALPPHTDLPIVAKAFIRPDPTHPFALVTLLQFDPRFSLLHMVAGLSQPGGPVGKVGTGGIPATDQNGDSLLAVLNGGFKYADGRYGMASMGTVYVPPQAGAATLAVTKEGKVVLGAWGVDPLLTSTNTDLAAWRQNAALLIDKGVINPLTQDGAAWGGTILNRAYTWRSGIGITAKNTLVYAAGDTLTAQTLADALRSAGAVMAMQTDINPFWVRAFLYQHLANGTFSISKLNSAMQGSGYEYLQKREQRDFFYFTRVAPTQPSRNALSHGLAH